MSYKAYAVLGIRLNENECCKERKEAPCSHNIPSGSAFCPHCGVKNEMKTRFDPIICEESEFPENVEMHDDTSGEMRFIGYGISARDGADWDGMLFKDDTVSQQARQTLKDFLEPLGLWKEDRFGVWVILRWLG